MADPVEFTRTEKLLHSPGLRSIGIEDSFWMGGGDDLYGRLFDEGWRTVAWVAPYYWVMKYEDRYISYTEGDVSFSKNEMCGARSNEE